MSEQRVHHLALREAPGLPSASEWSTLVEMARALVPTGFLPSSIKTPEQAVAIILKGRELRVPPMQALSQIVVVQGKPTCSAELMLALVYRDHGDLAVVVEESTGEACRVSYARRGWGQRRQFAFTIADAKTAGLTGKGGTWAQYPQAMLRARCVSAVARLAFPDSIGGMYTPEELGAAVHVDHEGRVELATVIDHHEPEAGPTPRQAAIRAAIDVDDVEVEAASLRGEIEDAAALELAEKRRQVAAMNPPNERARTEAPSGVPGDDVDSLTGEELADACDRLRRRLNAANLPYPPIPGAGERTARSLRAWWHGCAALLAPRP